LVEAVDVLGPRPIDEAGGGAIEDEDAAVEVSGRHQLFQFPVEDPLMGRREMRLGLAPRFQDIAFGKEAIPFAFWWVAAEVGMVGRGVPGSGLVFRCRILGGSPRIERNSAIEGAPGRY